VVAPTGDAEKHTAPAEGESPAAMESLEEGDVPVSDSKASDVPAAAQEKESVGDSLKKIFSKMAN
jgi:hypothetical protein